MKDSYNSTACMRIWILFLACFFSISVHSNIFFRDSINCPEYKDWKNAFFLGGYLPYESSESTIYPLNQVSHF